MKKFYSWIMAGCICFSLLPATGCGAGIEAEEAYSATAEAVKDLFDYNGALTMKMSYTTTSERKTSNEKNKEVETIEYSINPSKKMMYCYAKAEDGELAIKIVNKNNKYYLQTWAKAKDSSSEGNTTVETEKYQPIYMEEDVELLTSFQSFKVFTDQDLETIFTENLYSLSETQEAYNTVYAEQVAQLAKTDSTAHAEYKIKANKVFGKTTLKEVSKIQKTAKYGGMRGLNTLTETYKIECTNGKVKEMVGEKKFTFDNGDENSWREKTQTIDIDIKYSFDRIGYNKIKTTLPEFVDYKEQYIHVKDYKMKFNVGGVVAVRTVTDSSFNNERAFNNMKSGLIKGGYSVEWYANDSYTTKFEPGKLSYYEFCKQDCVYGKVTVQDNYAVIGTEYKLKDDRSDAYKVVFGPLFEETDTAEEFDVKYLPSMNSTTYTLPVKGGEYKSFLNGRAFDSSSNTIKLSKGRFYLVEHVKSVTDDGYSIFAWNGLNY